MPLIDILKGYLLHKGLTMRPKGENIYWTRAHMYCGVFFLHSNGHMTIT
jgi:hypothetical protein